MSNGDLCYIRNCHHHHHDSMLMSSKYFVVNDDGGCFEFDNFSFFWTSLSDRATKKITLIGDWLDLAHMSISLLRKKIIFANLRNSFQWAINRKKKRTMGITVVCFKFQNMKDYHHYNCWNCERLLEKEAEKTQKKKN